LKGKIMKNINVYYSPDYLCDGYGVDTREKAGEIATSLHDHPIEGVVLVEPEPVGVDVVTRVHTRRYVNALMVGRPDSLADANGIGGVSALFVDARCELGIVIEWSASCESRAWLRVLHIEWSGNCRT